MVERYCLVQLLRVLFCYSHQNTPQWHFEAAPIEAICEKVGVWRCISLDDLEEKQTKRLEAVGKILFFESDTLVQEHLK